MMAVIHLVVLSLLISSCAGTQKFALEPDNQSIVLGTKIILPCRVVDKQGTLQWTKDDFGLGTHRNLSGFERYKMLGTDTDGDYSLEIDPVTLEDDAKYQCQVSPGQNGQAGIRSRYAKVTVLVPPESPQISQGSFMWATEGDEIELECTAKGGKPAAELTWIDGLDNVLSNNITYDKELMPDGSRFLAKSRLRIKLTRAYHNTTFTCRSQNPADREFKSAELKIEVRYPPKISVEVIEGASDEGLLQEGIEASFSCLVDANPPEVTIRWYINDELVVGDYTNVMILHNVSRKHHKAEVKCTAENEVGQSEESLELDVTYAPVFLNRPESVEGEDQENIELSCEVDGNPVDIVWVYDPVDRFNHHPKVMGNEPTLPIVVSNATVGRYFCKASVPNFAEIKAAATVYIKSAPEILSPPYQYGIEGDTLRLECSAFSVPKARHVSWSFNGREINTNPDQEFSILEDPTPRGIKSTLIIRESKPWHFGQYNCTVVNDFGAAVMQIELIHQSKFQLKVTIIIGSVLGLIVFVTSIVICCLKCPKRKEHKMNEDEKSYKIDIIPEKHKISDKCWDNDGSSNSSDMKPDIRAGSSESDYSLASTKMAEINDNNSLDLKHIRRGTSVPLAGPVDFPINYSHSNDYTDTAGYLPKYGQNNYGYMTQSEYARYCPPPTQHYAVNRGSGPGSLTHSDNYSVVRGGRTDIRQDIGVPSARSSLIV